MMGIRVDGNDKGSAMCVIVCRSSARADVPELLTVVSGSEWQLVWQDWHKQRASKRTILVPGIFFYIVD